MPWGLMRRARDYKDKNWDGGDVLDSQNISGDPHIALAMSATECIGLGTAVTNSVSQTTRRPRQWRPASTGPLTAVWC